VEGIEGLPQSPCRRNRGVEQCAKRSIRTKALDVLDAIATRSHQQGHRLEQRTRVELPLNLPQLHSRARVLGRAEGSQRFNNEWKAPKGRHPRLTFLLDGVLERKSLLSFSHDLFSQVDQRKCFTLWVKMHCRLFHSEDHA
jgi:hypothetical protein